MKKGLFLLGCITLIFILSCNNKPGNNSDEDEIVNEEKNTEPAVVKDNVQSNARWEERKAKGDTLAMPYKDLQAYLPQINGYSNQGGPKGSQMNVPGMGSWSQAEQEYENGDKRITVSIFDYNSAR